MGSVPIAGPPLQRDREKRALPVLPVSAHETIGTMGDDYLPREEDIRPSGGVLVYEPPDTTEPPDDLGLDGLDGLDDRLRGVEKRLGQMTTWIIILVVVIFTLGVAAVVDLASYA